MRLTKLSLIIAVLAFAVFLGKYTFAEEPTKEVAKEASSTKILAQVNLQDASIVSQEENTLNITFNLNNREGAQSGVRYGIRLVEISEGKQIVADEYVYPEVLSLGENTTTTKNISYTPPFNISGEYNVYISAKNYSGIPLGSGYLGKVTFSEQVKTVEIIPGTCSTSVERADNAVAGSGSKTISLSKGDKISLNCVVKNNLNKLVIVSPIFETFIRSLYGEEVETLPLSVANTITLRPLEEKAVNFLIPENTTPQAYVTKIFVEGDGVKSNSILTSYSISGLSATIQNVSLDKTSYDKGELATISVFWQPVVANEEEAKSISYKADIVGRNKRSCLEKTLESQVTAFGLMEIPTNIVRSCDDPEVTIALLDATGKVLDQKALVFEANEKTNLFQGKTGMIAIIILVLLVITGIIIYVKNLKKDNKPKDDNSNTPKSGHIEGAMLAIFFILSMFLIPGDNAKADTIYVSPSGTSDVYPWDTSYGVLVLNFNLDKSTYSPGEYVSLESTVSYDFGGYDCSSINLTATPSSTWSSEQIDFNGETIICPDWEYGAMNNLYAGATAGSYYVDIYGTAYLRGIYAADVGWQMPFSVSSPSSTVDVTASNQQSLTVTSGTGVTIRWSNQNASSGTVCSCSISTGGNCGSPSTGPVTDYVGGTFTPLTTTTYTVNCNP